MAATAAPNSMVVGTRYRCAKRTRTELAYPADVVSCATATHTNWRDWANLTAGPAGLIVERVLADDVASYLRFRSVCVSWRRSTPSPHDILDRRFHPRQWIMLPEVFAAETKRRDFLNVSTGERIRVDLPELRSQFLLGHTSDGLIMLCQKGNGVVRLLNPLTRQRMTLPNAISLLSSLKNQNKRWRRNTGLRELKKLKFFSASLTGNSTLALHFDDHELAVAEPNVKRWSHRAWSGTSLESIIAACSFANRFYCFTRKGIMVMDSTGAAQGPQLVMVVKVDKDFFRALQHWNLMDNGGELILVRRVYGANNPIKYDVYLVDLDVGKMVPMFGLRGRALFVNHSFLGPGRALLVHAGLSSTITADTIYECQERGEGADRRLTIDTYDLGQKDWIKLDFLPCPGSIVNYLSRYVCRRSEDIVVPAPRCRSVGAADESAADPRKRKRKRKANPKVTGDEWVN